MAVQPTRLGKHGVLVSKLCLGTMNFGWHTSEEDSFRMMDRALELGINFFDTADVYGRGGEQGDTEIILGNWFALGDGRRDAVVLATKVYNPVKREENRREPNTDERSLSAYKIRKHCEGSLSASRPTTSTSTRCTTSTTRVPGTKPGKPLTAWCSKEKSCMWARATSRVGTSPPPVRKPPSGA